MRSVEQGGRADRRHLLQPRSFSSSDRGDLLGWLLPMVTDRSVLDIGCATGMDRVDWIHGHLVASSRTCLGADIDADSVERANAKGHAIVQADAEALDLGRKFEVIFAGEMIEHLACPGAFLESAARHLTPDGRLILTTPNAFAVSNFAYRVFPGQVRVNRDHTCWYCEDTVRQLLARFGFAAEVSYLRHRTPGSARRAAASAVRHLLPARVAWNTLGVVARLA